MGVDARIARLRISAEPGMAGRLGVARALVEDALRTEHASAGPGAVRGLLVVRRVDAGGIRAETDRSAVQRRLAGALADAGRRARNPLDAGAADADAVLFRDPLEPYALYAEGLFRGSSLCDAWFFRAIFGRRTRASAQDAWRQLLFDAADEPFAPLAVAEVIVRAGPVVGRLVTSISPADAAAILSRVVGGAGKARPPATVSADAPFGQATDEPVEPPCLRPVAPLQRAIAAEVVRSLGEDDRRAMLVVGAILVDACAAPVSAAAVVAAARALTFDAPAMARVPVDAAAPQARSEKPPDSRRTHAPEGLPDGSDAEAAQGWTRPPDRLRPDAAETADEPRDRSATKPEIPAQQARTRRDPSGPPIRPVPRADEQAERDRPPPGGPTPETEAAAEWPPDDPSPEAGGPVADPSAVPLPWGGSTAWAGGVLLIPAMDGVLAPLLNTPECMDSDFGRELLDRMLRRAGCSVRDPARRAFAPPARERCAAPPGFHLPAVFELFPARQMALHRIEGHPGWRVLTCRRRRIVLAMWSGRAQPTVRAWILAAANVRRAAPLPGPMPAILDTAELALRAWLRRETGYRIAEVLGRSGWVRATRSHIDVTFDASLVDLAIRRAGLDLDPGWCRWLLRVVAIHYDYGQHDA